MKTFLLFLLLTAAASAQTMCDSTYVVDSTQLVSLEVTIVNPSAGGNRALSKFVVGIGDALGISNIVYNAGRNPAMNVTAAYSPLNGGSNNYRYMLRISSAGTYIYDGVVVYLRIHYFTTKGSTSSWCARPAAGRGA